MSLNAVLDSLKDYAKDIRLNLSSITKPEGAPGLTEKQINFVLLSSVYATRSPQLKEAFESEFSGKLSKEEFEAAKAAAVIMGMNNIYYRSMHLIEDAELSKLPARLRMNIMAKPGVDKVDFELASLAISAISGCGKCLTSHKHELSKAGVSNEGIQSALRIAAVVNASAQALFIG